MKTNAINRLARVVAGAIVTAIVVCGSASESEAQYKYNPRARQAMINYQNALTAERNLYYRREAVYNRYAWGLRKAGQAGDLAGAGAAALASQGRLSRYAYGMARDQAISRSVTYGANRFFNNRYVAPSNARFWGYR